MNNNLPFYLETNIPLSAEACDLMEKSYNLAKQYEHEFITPEHLLFVLTDQTDFAGTLKKYPDAISLLKCSLNSYLGKAEILKGNPNNNPMPSVQLNTVVRDAEKMAQYSGRKEILMHHIVKAIMSLPDSYAQYYLSASIGKNESEFLSELLFNEEIEENFDFDEGFDSFEAAPQENYKWRDLVTCINDLYKSHNPLIGREEELERTIRVLCRKDKNNPLHIGDPGVGKTALVYGLAQKIEEGKVPEKLKGSKIYQIDLGNLIAGTQYRGDFEKKIKTIMEGLAEEQNVIVYIDEIHNLVGAGATQDNSLDASNMLKPYLESGKIRFIGATTHEEYKRYFSKSKGIIRRFTNIDINEPSVEEAVKILSQLIPGYEEFHGVKYSTDSIDYAVKASAKHIRDRFLPDKAIDLVDEAGSFREIHPHPEKGNLVDKTLISEILAKNCKVESLAEAKDEIENYENLYERISSQIFGQDLAVREVSESVLISKSGLGEENKPLASLLFVGPTGVGKTELAKVLAKELGIGFIRFDMSEYTEKHTVAKFIGSPAGYVGYEDGGLLTDAVRRTPSAVLLLDEIEKAHSDIYNILLQVMDYATLTDNKGSKADFRNIILIMTSNAGAQHAHQANVGFNSSVTASDYMLLQVKKTFKPEFLNRLSSQVAFNSMTKDMAALIFDKKISQLGNLLKAKNVTLNLSEEARNFLIDKGFTKEYGARHLERVIHNELKKKLMQEILFGKLKEGGQITATLSNKKINLI